MSRRTVSVYINKEINHDLEDHLNELSEKGESLSNFFIDAANYYIENNNQLDLDEEKLTKMVREIVQEEIKKYSVVEDKEVTTITDEEIAAKLKNIY